MTIPHVNGAGLLPVTARISLAAPALLILVGALLSGLSGGLMLALGKAGVAGAGAPVAARLAASPIPVVGAPGNICRTPAFGQRAPRRCRWRP